MQLTSHKNAKNKTNVMLQKESAYIVTFTFAVLLLGSFLANACVLILKNYGFNYLPGSYGSYLIYYKKLPYTIRRRDESKYSQLRNYLNLKISTNTKWYKKICSFDRNDTM